MTNDEVITVKEIVVLSEPAEKAARSRGRHVTISTLNGAGQRRKRWLEPDRSISLALWARRQGELPAPPFWRSFRVR